MQMIRQQNPAIDVKRQRLWHEDDGLAQDRADIRMDQEQLAVLDDHREEIGPRESRRDDNET